MSASYTATTATTRRRLVRRQNGWDMRRGDPGSNIPAMDGNSGAAPRAGFANVPQGMTVGGFTPNGGAVLPSMAAEVVGGGMLGSANTGMPGSSMLTPATSFTTQHSFPMVSSPGVAVSDGSSEKGNNTVVIASSVAGAVVAIALAVSLFVFRRRRQRAAQHGRPHHRHSSDLQWEKYSKTLDAVQTPYPRVYTQIPSPTGTARAMGMYPRPDSILSTNEVGGGGLALTLPDASYAPQVMGMVATGGVFSQQSVAGQRYLTQTVTMANSLQQQCSNRGDDADNYRLSEYSRMSALGMEDVELEITEAFPVSKSMASSRRRTSSAAIFRPSVASNATAPIVGTKQHDHYSHAGHQAGVGGTRPSTTHHHNGVSWPRRGRLGTGTEVFGMM